MSVEIDPETTSFVQSHRVARLATSSEDGSPSVVPICYVFDGERLYTPIDEKPKRLEPRSLKRIRNINTNPNVAIVVDDYSEDWSKLAYVLIRGSAEILDSGDSEHSTAIKLLREKYGQYQSMNLEERPIIKVTPVRIKRWASSGSSQWPER